MYKAYITKITNLRKTFGNNKVLENLSLEIKDGERVYIEGASGTGKTTLVRIICGLEACRGKVTVDKKVAVMFQENRLFDHLSALENVLCVCEKKTVENVTAAKKLLDRLELADFYNTPAQNLSGGMAQRVAFARFLAFAEETGATLLLLDEPFSALDEDMRERMIKLLLEFANGKSVIYVTHNTAEAEKISKTVIKL